VKYTGIVWCPRTRNSTWLAKRRGTVYFTGNSDRIPETIGRGGFLIHPKCEGMEFPMASYAPQCISHLEQEIEYWLSHEDEREDLRRAGFEWFKQNGTWAHRILDVLNHLGFN